MFVNRTKQSIRNIRVSLCFSILILVLRFFSRKVFIDHIGIEVLGLNTALTSLLNLLNLTELGIGSAVSYFLYIPLAQSDCKTVNEIVSLQGWLYKRVTYVILVGSIVFVAPSVAPPLTIFLDILTDETAIVVCLWLIRGLVNRGDTRVYH